MPSPRSWSATSSAGALEVRRAAPGDWRTLRDVRLAALEEAPYAFASNRAREADFDESEWRRRIAGSATFLAWRDGEPVGVVVGISADDAPADERHVVSMWVDSHARGSGVAPALMDAVVDWARSDGAAQLTLWVADGNERARRFYERWSFVTTGERQPLPSNPEVSEEKLQLPL